MAETGQGTAAGSRTRSRILRRTGSDERLVSLVRRGERAAFEALYDRHAAALLSYSYFMLGSREDAEDAVQSTFASAYRALLRDERHVDLRPWLFAIARNACIGILRKRRPQDGERIEQVAGEDLFARVERRESLRRLLAGMLALPERHRTALLLAELHGHSQREIGHVLGVSPATVKSYIFQARTTLASELVAREAACEEIREELADARGAALLRGRLRRHLRSCADCRAYAEQRSRERRALGALMPLLPTLALKRRVLDTTAGQAAGLGAAGTAGLGATLGGAVELGGAGAKTLLAKLLIGATGLAASAGAGTLALDAASSAPARSRSHAAAHQLALAAPARGSRATAPAMPYAGSRGPDTSAPGSLPSSGASRPAAGSAGEPASPKATRPEQRAPAAILARAGTGGQGKSTTNGAGSSGKTHGNAGSPGENGKAKGRGEERGNSGAAHEGGNGNAQGNGKARGHAQGNGNAQGSGHGNAAAHGGSVASGTAAAAGGPGNGAGGNGAGPGQAIPPGQANGVPHVDLSGSNGQAGGNVGAQGLGHAEVGQAEVPPTVPLPKEPGASAGPQGQGSGSSADHEPPGQAKR